MRSVFLVISIFYFTQAYPQLKGTIPSGETYSIDTLGGMYNGLTTLFGKDGKKRLEGNYKDNQKTGIWTVWDTLGRIRMRAYYKYSYIFNNLKLYNSVGNPILIMDEKQYLVKRVADSLKGVAEKQIDYTKITTPEHLKIIYPSNNLGFKRYFLQRDSSNVVQYPKTAHRDIVYSPVFLTYLDAGGFGYGQLTSRDIIGSIKSYINEDSSPGIYTTQDFDMKMAPGDALVKITNDAKIAGFKLKEIYYFDRQRLHGSIRIIGICPVSQHPVTQQYEELFWLYYPSFREFLSIPITHVSDNSDIRTLEDIFHFRRFESFIYYRVDSVDNKSNSSIKLSKGHKPERSSLEGVPLYLEWKAWNMITY